MSLLDDVSIVVTPNGYKAGELYAVIPSNGDADMDVTRATDATRVDENGLIADVLSGVPRIDYTGGGCPHILAEPMRTNKITYSSDFSQSSWFKTSGVTLTSNYGLSPDGNNNSTRLQLSTNNEQIYDSIIHSGSTETASIYVKGTSGETIQFGVGNNISQGGTYTLNGEWQRINQQSTSGSVLIIGNKDLTATDFEIFAAQVEVGSYPTSYIPTSGSTVTRNQDIFTRDGIGSLINSTEGVLFVEMAALSTSIDSGYLSLNNGGNYQIRIGYLSENIYIQIRINGAVPYSYSFAGTITDFNKIAVKWTATEQKVYVNGSPVDTGTASTIFPSGTLNNMEFAVNTVTPVFAKVKQLQVYDTALSPTQLAALTS